MIWMAYLISIFGLLEFALFVMKSWKWSENQVLRDDESNTIGAFKWLTPVPKYKYQNESVEQQTNAGRKVKNNRKQTSHTDTGIIFEILSFSSKHVKRMKNVTPTLGIP